MTDNKNKGVDMKIRGRESSVVKGSTQGGTIVTRLPPDLHRQFAIICKQRNASMNETVVNLIHNFCYPPSPRNNDKPYE